MLKIDFAGGGLSSAGELAYAEGEDVGLREVTSYGTGPYVISYEGFVL